MAQIGVWACHVVLQHHKLAKLLSTRLQFWFRLLGITWIACVSRFVIYNMSMARNDGIHYDLHVQPPCGFYGVPLWAEQYATVGDRLLPSSHTPHPILHDAILRKPSQGLLPCFGLMLACTSALIYTNAMGIGMHPRMEMPLVYTQGVHPCNT